MIKLETMTLAELNALAETTKEVRKKRLNDELTKREEAIQSLLDECFDLIEESGIKMYADTAGGEYSEHFDFSEILTFEFEDE